jgi:hypothetical protein
VGELKRRQAFETLSFRKERAEWGIFQAVWSWGSCCEDLLIRYFTAGKINFSMALANPSS